MYVVLTQVLAHDQCHRLAFHSHQMVLPQRGIEAIMRESWLIILIHSTLAMITYPLSGVFSRTCLVLVLDTLVSEVVLSEVLFSSLVATECHHFELSLTPCVECE